MNTQPTHPTTWILAETIEHGSPWLARVRALLAENRVSPEAVREQAQAWVAKDEVAVQRRTFLRPLGALLPRGARPVAILDGDGFVVRGREHGLDAGTLAYLWEHRGDTDNCHIHSASEPLVLHYPNQTMRPSPEDPERVSPAFFSGVFDLPAHADVVTYEDAAGNIRTFKDRFAVSGGPTGL